jgi:predicted branched-subunit amino acid permease
MIRQDHKEHVNPPLGFLKGVKDILPLCIAVIPWAVLAGSVAVNAGLTFMQAFGMSALVFAGAAQLVSLSMLSAGASIFSIVFTVFFLTSQHFIYALHLQKDIRHRPIMQRVLIGFLLTDELYATAMLNHHRPYRYLLGAGMSFYLCWVAFSFVGIQLASQIPDLSSFHLEFSIVAIFIVMAVLLIKNKIAMVGVCISAMMAVVFTWLQFDMAMLLAGLSGMCVSACLEMLLEAEV